MLGRCSDTELNNASDEDQQNMRIVDFCINRGRGRRREWQIRALQTLQLKLPLRFVDIAGWKDNKEHVNVRLIAMRNEQVRAVYFNINPPADKCFVRLKIQTQ